MAEPHLQGVAGERLTGQDNLSEDPMPKKKAKLAPAEQSAALRAEVESLIAAGELSPTEAERTLDLPVRKQSQLRS